MTSPLFFVPPPAWTADERSVAAAIHAARGDLSADRPATRTSVLIIRDTVARRLARRGCRLSSLSTGSDRDVWTLHRTDGGVLATETLSRHPAAFGDDLPTGPLRAHLEELTKGRALQSIIQIGLTERTVALRDRDGKIRSRLVFTTATTDDGATESDLTVKPLKGYERDTQRVQERLADALGWAVTETPAVDRLLAAVGDGSRTAPAAENDIRPDDPAGPAMREILSAQLDVMEDRLPGVLADRHPDYLHQFRVAIRRTRSALSQLGDAIALEGRTEAIDGFRWLGRITSPVRDLDVQMMDLAGRRKRMEGDPHALDALERHLAELKTTAHRDLVLDLSGSRFRSLVLRWRDTLSPSSANWTATETLRAPFAEIVSARAAKLLRKVLRDGRKIGPETDAEKLHDLRKRMKKLRYVTEFLAEVLPRDRSKPAIKALKGLQDVLGRVQDREIQVEALHGYGRVLSEGGDGDAETLMAIGAWTEELDSDRQAARAEFADAFEVFAAEQTQALFHDIFDGKRRLRRRKED